MTEEITFDNGWWKIHQRFTPNEIFGDKMLGHGSEEKLAGDDKPHDPNTCYEDSTKQLEVGLAAGENVNQVVASHAVEKEIDDGDHAAQEKNGKGIEVHKRKRIDLAKHIVVEKKRRDIEAKQYQELLALLPHLTTKNTKATIVQEAEYIIKSMEETLHGLEKQKQENLHGAFQSLVINNTESPNLLTNKDASINLDDITDQSSIGGVFKVFASSNVTLNVCGANAIINICFQRIPGLFTSICSLFEKHNTEVVHAEISSDHAMALYQIRVRANVPPELAKGFPYEEMYKEAVAEIMQLVAMMN
ncbi:uncharacterized protein LOC143621581 [Bidens hawaiensis]|uniref:uncharacterized protein LOC143621581 n=1 Tax=Bidens hawaiensis TaxID=980011 RepID=UPI00404B50A7